MFALGPYVMLDGTRPGGTLLGAVLRGQRGEALLGPRDVTALFQLCGVLRRRGEFPPPPDEIARLAQRLTSEGFVVPLERPTGGVGPDHHVVIAHGTDIRPILYEARDVKTRLGFVGAFDAVLIEASDGQSGIPTLCAAAARYGFQTTPAEVQQRLEHLHAAHVVAATVPAPRRVPTVALHPEAFIAQIPRSEVRYLLSTDEADALLRCQTPRVMADLFSELGAGTPDQQQWLEAVIVKASGLGIVTVTPDPRAFQAPAPASRHNVRPVFEQDDEATRMDVLADLEFGGDTNLERHGSNVTPNAHGEVMQVPMAAPQQMPMHHNGGHDASAYGHAQPAPLASSPPQGFGYPRAPSQPHTTQPSQPYMTQPSQPHMAQPSQPYMAQPSQPHMAQPSQPYMAQPSPHMTPAHAFPTVDRPSGQMAAPPRSGAFPTMHAPTGADPVTNTKLASLAALSLDKGNAAVVASSSHRSGGGSKLPWVLLVLAVAGGGYYIYSSRGKTTAPVATKDETGSAVQVAPSRVGLTAAGFLAAREPIVLSATTAGRLDKVTVKNGDRIKKGQLLAALADGQIRAELSRENSRVRNAQRALARIKKLVRAQAATQLELDKAQGELELAQADARVVGQRLKETQILAPIDGTVLEVLVRPGETIKGDTGVLRIADVSALAAEVNVAESDLKRVFPGQECDVVTDSQRDKTFRGVVREIAQQADRARGTVLVKVNVDATPESELRPNMAVQVRFKPREEVPAGAGSASPAAGSATSAAGSAAAPAPAPSK